MSKIARTPPNNSPSAEGSDCYVNTRKRGTVSTTHDLDLEMSNDNNKLTQLFESLEKKIMSTITNTVTTLISNELSKISDSLSSLNITISEIRQENYNLKQGLNLINNRLSDIDTAMSNISDQSTDFDSRLKHIENLVPKDNDQLVAMENKITTLEQQARDCNIEISNLPERRSENLVSIVTNIGQLINQRMETSDIVAAHRVPHVGSFDKRPKNVIIRFSSKILRDNFLASYRIKKGLTSDQLFITGEPVRIYVNEHLTLKNKQIFRESRDKAKTYNYKYVWFKNGTVMVRKTDTSSVLPIRSLDDIKKIKP